MTRTEAQKRAEAKYAKKNLTIVGCKVRREEAEAFKAVCKAAGTTPNAAFRQCMKDFMQKEGRE